MSSPTEEQAEAIEIAAAAAAALPVLGEEELAAVPPLAPIRMASYQIDPYLFTEPPMGRLLFMFLPAMNTGFATNVNVLAQPFAGTMQEYKAATEAQVQQLNCTVSSISLEGEVFTIDYEGHMSGRDLQFLCKVIRSNSVMFVATATCLKSNWGEYEKALHRCIDNFTIPAVEEGKQLSTTAHVLPHFSIEPLTCDVSATTPHQTLHMLGPPSNAFQRSVNVVSQAFTGTMDEYAAISEGSIVQQGWTMLESNVDEANDTYTLEYQALNVPNQPAMHFYAKVIRCGQQIELATVTVLESTWEQHAVAARACINSFSTLN